MKQAWPLAALLVACATVPAVSQTVPTSDGNTTAPASTSTPTTAVPATTTSIPTTTTLAPLLGVELELVTEGLTEPIYLVSPPHDQRRFVVERSGVISILDASGTLQDEPYLDLRERVNSAGLEQGLLGMTFHPEYATNGRFFVYYYKEGVEQTQLSEFAVSGDPDRGDPTSERFLIAFDKPTIHHNGGMLLFGPDGYLWMSLGEGGKASVHSQDPNRLLSSILRLDVNTGDPYGIPPDNPYSSGGGAPEVWAKGLRNPWRFTIDDGLIYIADVGHSEFEEIDIVPLDGAPYNFGWLRMEGNHCFQRGCDALAENLTLPVLEYTHSEGCSITGGFVYRGTAIPELTGHYFYSDWCGEWVRSFQYVSAEVTDHQTRFEQVGQVNSYGLDSDGELYLLTNQGTILKLVPIR